MKDKKTVWDVLIIGGGHAGAEAALAAARMGCKTLLVVGNANAIGMMPCNPAIGGLAKSHLVYELDALGGEMGLNADLCGIQFKTLNVSRGPAVQATRIQCDKQQYATRLRRVIDAMPGLTVLEDEVTAVEVYAQNVTGVITAKHGKITAQAVVLATGTALNGRIYIGKEVKSGGGDGRLAANFLAASLKKLGFEMIRLKTGTPPRLLANSIDWEHTTVQPGEEPPPFFSLSAQMFHVEQSMSDTVEKRGQGDCSTWNIWAPWAPGKEQESCWLTHTTSETHQIIREHLHESALYGGAITGTGVRYCPSIEDKVVKFADVQSHHVFLEPEGRATSWIYPNGLSNSLPRDVQVKMVRSVLGLARAEFAAYAYAIEYESIDARELRHTLESKRIAGLYFAGQVNGTTGYEEAAAQGFMAGVNAALRVQGREALVLSRQDAYIGVMIDDLVTKGTDEPYRMFTSRAERRLILRQDNARYRLLQQADVLGIAPAVCRDQTRKFENLVCAEMERLATTRVTGVSLWTMLARPAMRYAALSGCRADLPPAVVTQIEIRIKYEGYIAQEQAAAVRSKSQEAQRIPIWMDYWKLPSLRYESREKLDRIRPHDLGQASRIPGVNPSDIAILSLIIKRGR